MFGQTDHVHPQDACFNSEFSRSTPGVQQAILSLSGVPQRGPSRKGQYYQTPLDSVNNRKYYGLGRTHSGQLVSAGHQYYSSHSQRSMLAAPCCIISRFNSLWMATGFFLFFPWGGSHAWGYTLSFYHGHCRCCMPFHYYWISSLNIVNHFFLLMCFCDSDCVAQVPYFWLFLHAC